MSLRRQSCDACYRERRRCDLAHPVCARCRQRNKDCTYLYPPPLRQSPEPDHSEAGGARRAVVRSKTFSRKRTAPCNILPPRSLGNLGRLQPVSNLPGYDHMSWVFDLLRESPLTFADRGETVFIHKALFQGGRLPGPLLTAFGISAGCASLNDHNRHILFQALDAQTNDLLLATPRASTANRWLLDDLARFQALVLYQIIRLFYGGVEQREVSERQAYAVRAQGLRLLRSADNTITDVEELEAQETQTAAVTEQTWEKWILAESIRRTVFIAFKLYTLYTAFRYGQCVETVALDMLPVSTRPARAWYSREFYDDREESPERAAGPGDDTTTASAFISSLGMIGRADLETFERIVLSAACKRAAAGMPGVPCNDGGDLRASSDIEWMRSGK
ncbi:uncharacterized protein C8A04DRAFT_15755 [Dichotomopilus funicola]|uniref:Zn(2)-C6 fungal-type domain-containing protein n=1 Tax=Dichotomopilus funicola TaxID=1934379 RepID=A0AAN6UV24_9PEZI|nr:hypothetical protein C8A04DRAFT_15755 [Dichotomopilus funicola]